MIAIAVTALFGVVAVAQASNTYTVTVAKVSPSKAGTALKPKPITINFGYQVGETTNNRPSVTTDYVIAFGKQIKSHRSFFKGSKVCTVAQAGYSSGQPPKCPATAKAGGREHPELRRQHDGSDEQDPVQPRPDAVRR